MPSTTATDEIFSDESSFYGDDDEKTKLEAQVSSYDPEPFWVGTHPKLLSTMQQHLRASSTRAKATSPDVCMSDAPPETDSMPRNKRGKTEPVDHFLSRLPPSTTETTVVGPWIWMYNPHLPSKTSGDVPALLRRGRELLQEYENGSAILREAHDRSGAKTTAALTRKLNPLRKELEKDILDLARETGVTNGKWMLFPTVGQVDEFWGVVVRAMEKGELGDAVKVATNGGSGASRLICVYTADFGDVEDVKRVVSNLDDLGLVGKGPRSIYYKSDAFTHLDITSKNEYGLKASMYSSRELLEGK
ncbi:hypothetical protein DTO006G1_9482 [Penicillium roqueforti]|nr:hypothetical protein CBS147337_3807 [Penicillium roqueforti]KAI2712242.1 hypothetical protein CBS147354_8114 [Penicillium roqueforti]KAI2751940.1 hypothetical protein DTO006G1_9482 [Penicillium roqueforti]KAI3096994.1 hypothetical protein CBS147333_9448 [Penicillium roqueforti]KAI3119859.1 hypothetical protein CBS147326_9693 [Penicillium roqueforti]